MISASSPADLQTIINSSKVVLVDLWAPWCGPCKMMMPHLEAVAKANPDVMVVKVNVDEAKEVARHYQVRSIPTLLLCKDGQMVRTVTGAQTAAALQSLVDVAK